MRVMLPALILVYLTTASSVTAAGGEPDADAFDAPALEFFERQIRPLLVRRCHECHSASADELKGGLRLDSREAALAGGDTGPAIVPGKLEESLLLDAISYDGLYDMPPKSKLPEEEIELLRRWVEMGAPWTPEEVVHEHQQEEFDLQARKASHWCWRPLDRRLRPQVVDTEWPQRPLDHFILAELEAVGLSPAASADRATLIRRATFALLGLPPTPEEVRAFVADPSPRAYQCLIDRLLGSPHFGERWARHWLDLVRYAETFGHEFDYAVPHASTYRDYLIRAFNFDVPYDQLVMEHVAGDLLERPRQEPIARFNESIIGTGFWWLGEATHAPVDVRDDEAGRIDNQIDVFSKTFLGVTLACARCHDHKFDAISTRDYYAFAGFLQSSRRHEAFLDLGGEIRHRTRQIRNLRYEGTEQLRQALLADDALTGRQFTRYLLAAAAAAVARPLGSADSAAPSVEAIAEEFNVERKQFSRWVTALQDPELAHQQHPLHAWHDLSSRDQWSEEEGALLRDALEQTAGQAQTANAALPCLVDFGREVSQWQAFGAAFETIADRDLLWDWERNPPQFAIPGVISSGRASGRLQGAYYSPEFTITHPQILYRLKGRGVKIRVIVDGYFMDTYNSLLFRGLEFAVDSPDQFQWYVQSGDLGRYIGHRAHIEILDHGDGSVTIDEIRFSHGPAAQQLPSGTARQAMQMQDVRTPADLAEIYGRLWDQTRQRLANQETNRDDVIWLNWALRHELLLHQSEVAQLMSLGDRVRSAADSVPATQRVLAMTEGTAENERVFIRGNYRTPGEEAERQLLEAIVGRPPRIEQGSGRLVLARQLIDPDNPLTARVMVNRLWQHLFGRGLVESVDNFGVLGQPPTHPELLDHLAARFVDQGWSIKAMLRELMLSSTYQMSSAPRPEATAVDAQNRMLHRMRVQRLQGEVLRDAMLSISGRLDRRQFGPGVATHLTEFMQGRGRPKESGPLDGAGRRSIYQEVRRNFLPPMMLAFDTPIPFSTVGRRNVSNVPAQALILMNDPFVVEQAENWARRVMAARTTWDERLDDMYLAAFGRTPSAQEREAARAFFDEQSRRLELSADQAADQEQFWADLAHVLFNVKEFVFIP